MFEITCAVTFPNKEGQLSFEWFFREERIRDFGNNPFQDKFFRDETGEGYEKRVLVVRRSKLSQTGLYTCRVYGSVNGMFSRIQTDINVNVRPPHHFRTLAITPPLEVVVMPGTTVAISCSAPVDLHVVIDWDTINRINNTWEVQTDKDRVLRQVLELDHSATNPNLYYQISTLYLPDVSDYYTCSFVDPLFSDVVYENTTKLIVTDADNGTDPNVPYLDFPTRVTVFPGSNTRIKCSIPWLQNYTLVINEERSNLTSGWVTHEYDRQFGAKLLEMVLEIFNMPPYGFGMFSCTLLDPSGGKVVSQMLEINVVDPRERV